MADEQSPGVQDLGDFASGAAAAASSGRDYKEKCCPHVVNPKGLFALLAGIGLVTFFLNNQEGGGLKKLSIK